MSTDPERWSSASSDAPETMRQMLEQARQMRPTREESERMLARIQASEGALTATSIGVAAAIAGAIALVATGVWTVRAADTHDALAPEVRPSAPLVEEPARVTPSERVEPAAAPLLAREPHENAAPQSEPAPTAERVQNAARPGNDGAARGAPSAKPSEAALLHAARAELSANPTRAIELLKVHRQEYPSGILAEERDALLVEALARAGKARAAAEESEAFKSAHPDSALRPK